MPTPQFNNVLFVRPNFDDATRYGNYWFGLCVDHARSRGLSVTDLNGGNATKANLEAELQRNGALFCCFTGHGNANIYTVQNKEVAITGCVNDELLRFRVTYLLSCLCGQQLLPSMQRKGAKAAIGYDVEFTWLIDQSKTPSTDPYAKPYQEFNNTIITTLLDGGSVIKAAEAGEAVVDRWLDDLSGSSDPYAREIMKWLVWDLDGLVVKGDPNATVTSGITLPSTANLPLILGAVSIGGLALYWNNVKSWLSQTFKTP